MGLLDLRDYDESDINGNKKIQVAVNGEEARVEGKTTCVIRRAMHENVLGHIA